MQGSGGRDSEPRRLWQRWTMTEAAAPDALTLAAFAEGGLSAAERAAVAAFLEENPEIAGDVAAARALAALTEPADPAARLDAVIARAAALVAAPAAAIVPFRTPPERRRAEPRQAGWQQTARWGLLAASLALVSWAGFTLGNNAYGDLASLTHQTGSALGDDMLDPPTGFLDFGEANQS